VQRKIFRVEQTFADRQATTTPENAACERPSHEGAEASRRPEGPPEENADVAVNGPARDFALLREIIASNRHELGALLGERGDRRMTRAAAELGAAVDAMEKATQKILHATECIDDSARALGATLKNDYERGLAQETQDQVAAIYEACNFQDLAGQRIGKVIDILGRIELQLAAMVERCGGSARAGVRDYAGKPGSIAVYGPRLDGESGHVDQNTIDAMFN
jgi:chemotaxis protein CheZ